MAKEIERTGIPVILLCNLVSTGVTTGANRIVPSVAITHPLGNPDMSPSAEKELRKKIIRKALNALQVNIEKETVFEREL